MAIAAREGEPKGRTEPPSLRFEIVAPGQPTRTIELRQDIVRIGKLSSSHLQVQDAAVSRVHAVIEATGQGEIFIIDLGSSNGTFVNGQKIAKERLKTGDTITLGQTNILFAIDDGESRARAPEAAETTTGVTTNPLGTTSPSPPSGAVDKDATAAGLPGHRAEPAAKVLDAAPLAREPEPAKEVEAAPEKVEPAVAAPKPQAAPDLFTAASAKAEPAKPAPKVEEPKPEPRPSAAAASKPAADAPISSVASANAASPAPAPEPAKAAPGPAPEVGKAALAAPTKTGAPAREAKSEVPPAAKPRAVPPAQPQGAERRFIAITAAEPLSKEPTDKANVVEVRLAFGRDIIEARTFESGKGKTRTRNIKRRAYRKTAAVTVGASQQNDFVIEDIAGVTEASFTLLRATPDGFVLCFNRQMLGRVRLADEDVDVTELIGRHETEDKGGGDFEWPFRRGSLVSLKAGGTTLYLRSVPKAPKPPIRYLEVRDPKLLLAFLGVLFFTTALMWRALTWPETPAVLLEDKLKLDDKMVSFLINPEERMRRAKIYGAKSKEKEAGAQKDKEGKSGDSEKPKADKPKKLAVQGKEKELTPAEQREKDLKKVRALGVLKELSQDSTLKEVLAGGGMPGAPSGIGPGSGGDPSTDWGGFGPGGGEGAGLAAFGGGGQGAGGGGDSRYVGVGRLRTKGGYGGRGGRDFGSGEARIGEREPVKPIVKVEEPDVSGGLTREIIRRVIRNHLHEVRYCYSRELQKNPSLYGRVLVQFTILPSGKVAQASILRSTMNNENVPGCILTRVRGWTFPKPYKGASVIVKYPFRFKAAGKD
jgi:TonB family protein